MKLSSTIFLVSFLLLVQSFSQTCVVVADGVNLRRDQGTNSEVIGTLNKNEKLTILTSQKSNFFIGSYLGVWQKVQTSNGSIGFVFSAFTSSNQEEKFHNFFARISNAFVSRDSVAIKNDAVFPLPFSYSCPTCGPPYHTNYLIPRNEFQVSNVFFGFSREVIFSLNEMGEVVVILGSEGGADNWYFSQIKGKWFLVRISRWSC